jgi:hypothetical protein
MTMGNPTELVAVLMAFNQKRLSEPRASYQSLLEAALEPAIAAATERGRQAGLREAAEIAKAYAQKWAASAKREKTEMGEAVCESAASSGNELATVIRARIKEGPSA